MFRQNKMYQKMYNSAKWASIRVNILEIIIINVNCMEMFY
jgi:hypothetical protein